MDSASCACRSPWHEPHDPTGRKRRFFVRSSLTCVWKQFLFRPPIARICSTMSGATNESARVLVWQSRSHPPEHSSSRNCVETPVCEYPEKDAPHCPVSKVCFTRTAPDRLPFRRPDHVAVHSPVDPACLHCCCILYCGPSSGAVNLRRLDLNLAAAQVENGPTY